jgi:hypothetical protein
VDVSDCKSHSYVGVVAVPSRRSTDEASGSLCDSILESCTMSDNIRFDVSEERVLSIFRVTDCGVGACLSD